MASYKKAYSEGLKPDPILTVTEWAREHRILSSVSSAEVGKYNPDRTPYGIEIMDNLSVTSPYTEVIWMKGAQIGATEIGNNWLGYIIDHAPAPTMSVMPNLDSAKKNSKTRIQPMIDASPRLSARIKPANTKDAGNTTLQKDFPGGVLLMGGANSAVSLRSSPIRNLYLDEEDGYPEDCAGEGDPVKLAKKRTDTFSSKKKIFHTSTPTVEGKSKIEVNFNKTDQRKYFMPCPECDHMQWLQWQQLRWEKGKPETVRYHCENEECGYEIENWQKTDMLAAGKWRATSESTSDKIVGYHLSGLYSPVGWLSWEDVAREWEEVNNPLDLEGLQTFMNTVLGESWKDKGEAPDWEKLYDRREKYKINEIPNGVCFLTAGVDIQKDRIEVEIVGWGRGKRSWSIDYRILEGDTDSIDCEPWLQLQDVLAEVWTAPNGVDMDIKRMAVDSGWNTQTVYSWVRQFSIHKVIAIKGSDHQQVTINQGTPVDIRKKGKARIRKALKLFTIGVSGLKQELYGWLKNKPAEADSEKQDPFGLCHFPEYDQEHFKRLTSETLETKWVKGKKTYEWVANGRNEQLDCRVYARAAASFYGMDRFKEHKWLAFEAEVGANLPRQTEQTVQKSIEKPQKATKKKLKRRKSNFT